MCVSTDGDVLNCCRASRPAFAASGEAEKRRGAVTLLKHGLDRSREKGVTPLGSRGYGVEGNERWVCSVGAARRGEESSAKESSRKVSRWAPLSALVGDFRVSA
jgi:hypothetical protein